MVEILDRALVAGLYVKLLEKGVREVGSVGTRSRTQQEGRRERFGGVKDAGHVAVEGE